jgi:ESCRT-II complex subunit VPS36
MSALTKDHFASGGGNNRQGRKKNKKHAADREYHEWLARQVVDFLWNKLPAMGGVITLTDVYCLFNRARGTNLVSPEDLRHACALLDSSSRKKNGNNHNNNKHNNNNDDEDRLYLGISQRTFDSGIVVLQLDRQEASGQALVDLCPATAMEASHVLKVSPLLALEQLKEAEQAGWLCRDVTLETTRFYPNRFNEYVERLPKR